MSYKGLIRCNSRVSKEERDFYEMKNKAAEFYHGNGVQEKIERVLSDMFYDKPEDVYGYLANYFTQLSAPPRISRLKGSEVYDARGQLSIQAEVFCIIRNEEKWVSSAAIASDCGFPEEARGPSAGREDKADHVMTALRWINEPLSNMLKGLNPCDQAGVDDILSNFFMARYLEEKEARSKEKEVNDSHSELEVEPPPPLPPAHSKEKKASDKGKKGNSVEKPVPPRTPKEPALPGSMAVGSVSLAVAKTGAQLQGVPLYKYIATLKNQVQREFRVPVPLVTLLSCGKTSPGKLNLLEEIILIPKAGQRVRQITAMALQIQKEMTRIMTTTSKAGAVQAAAASATGAPVAAYERPEQPLDAIADACRNLGLPLGTELHLAVNCAADELMDYSKGKYDVVTGSLKSPDELVDMYQALVSKYPAVVALIDPLRKEDVDQWERLSSVLGASCCLLSDISFKPPGHGLQPHAPPLSGVKGYILKQTNETSLSDLIRITTDHQDAVILGTTCSEPCHDDALSDLAVGLGMSYFKLGGLSGGERLTKYNRLISIEEELAQQGILGSFQTSRSIRLAGETEGASCMRWEVEKLQRCFVYQHTETDNTASHSCVNGACQSVYCLSINVSPSDKPEQMAKEGTELVTGSVSAKGKDRVRQHLRRTPASTL
ncbi:enolase 4 [Polymixia lowei]